MAKRFIYCFLASAIDDDYADTFLDLLIRAKTKKKHRFSQQDDDHQDVVRDSDILDDQITRNKIRKQQPNVFIPDDYEEITVQDTGGTQIPFDQQPFKRINRSKLNKIVNAFEELLGNTGCPPDDILHIAFATLFPPCFPGPMAKSGQYIMPYANSTGSVFQCAANRISFVPLQIPYPVHIVELGVWIIVRDDVGNGELGIYSFERGLIGPLIYKNCIKFDTFDYRAVAADVHLPAGSYMLALLTDTSVPTLRNNYVINNMLGHPTPDWTLQKGFYGLDSAFVDGLPETVDNDLIELEPVDECPQIIAKLG